MPPSESESSPARRGIFTRWLLYFGPAFIAGIAYINPGNFATNIEGGAKFGYALLWVIVASNLISHGTGAGAAGSSRDWKRACAKSSGK